jgi:hypothetical protein
MAFCMSGRLVRLSTSDVSISDLIFEINSSKVASSMTSFSRLFRIAFHGRSSECCFPLTQALYHGLCAQAGGAVDRCGCIIRSKCGREHQSRRNASTRFAFDGFGCLRPQHSDTSSTLRRLTSPEERRLGPASEYLRPLDARSEYRPCRP